MRLKIDIGLAFLLIGCGANQHSVYLNLNFEDSETGMAVSGVFINLTAKSPGFPMDKIRLIGDFCSDENGEFEYEFQTSANQICLLFHKDIEGTDFLYDLDWKNNPIECFKLNDTNEKIALKIYLKKRGRFKPVP